jgi:hypothetical protein
MEKDNILKDVFMASFGLHSSGVDEGTKQRLEQLIAHKDKTTSIALVLVPLLWFATVYFEMKDINTAGVIPVVLLLALYARYRDLYKQCLEVMKNMKNAANQSSDPA